MRTRQDATIHAVSFEIETTNKSFSDLLNILNNIIKELKDENETDKRTKDGSLSFAEIPKVFKLGQRGPASLLAFIKEEEQREAIWIF